MRFSPQRLLIESAMAGSARSAVEWRALFEEVMVVRRLLAALGNNVNQLARVANATGEPPVLDAPLEMVTRVLARTDATLAALRQCGHGRTVRVDGVYVRLCVDRVTAAVHPGSAGQDDESSLFDDHGRSPVA